MNKFNIHFINYSKDEKYLGTILKCLDKDYVRCCGASSSFVVGMATTPRTLEPIQLTESTTNRQVENSFVTDTTEVTTTELNNEITETTANPNDQNKLEQETNDETTIDYTTEPITTEYLSETTISPSVGSEELDMQRRPKFVNNVIMVYPNEMSGIPKSKPKDMPGDGNEMDEFDENMGMNLHVIFSSNEPTEKQDEHSNDAVTTETDLNTTTEIPENVPATVSENIVPLTTQITTDETTTASVMETDTETQTSIASSTELAAAQSELHAQNLKTISEAPKVNDKELKRRRYTQYRRRIFERTTTPNGGVSTTIAPTKVKTRLRELYKKQSSENTEPTEKKIQVETSTRTIYKTRKQLFNAHNRQKYLRKKTETDTTVTIAETPKTTTTPIPKMEHTTPVAQKKVVVKEMVDAEHRFRIKGLRKTLLAVTNPNSQQEIPRAISDQKLSDRVHDVEHLLRRKMKTAFREIIENTKTNIKEQGQVEEVTATTKRPYRGHRRFNTSLINEPVSIPRRHRPAAIDTTRTTTTIKPEGEISSFNRILQSKRTSAQRSNISSYLHKHGRQSKADNSEKKVKIVSRAVSLPNPSLVNSDGPSEILLVNIPTEETSNDQSTLTRKVDNIDSIETSEIKENSTNADGKQLPEAEYIFVNDFMQILAKALEEQELMNQNDQNETNLSPEALLNEMAEIENITDILRSEGNETDSNGSEDSDEPEILHIVLVSNDTNFPSLDNFTDENFDLISAENIENYFKNLFETTEDESDAEDKQEFTQGIEVSNDDSLVPANIFDQSIESKEKDSQRVPKSRSIISSDNDDEFLEAAEASAFIPDFKPAPEWVKNFDNKYLPPNSNHISSFNQKHKTYNKPYKPATYHNTLQPTQKTKDVLAPSSLYASTYGIESPHTYEIIGPIPKPLVAKERKLSFGLPYSGSRFR